MTGNGGHGRFPVQQRDSQVGFNPSRRPAGQRRRRDGPSPTTDLWHMRISLRKRVGGVEGGAAAAAASEVITEAKTWLAFNYLNKFCFSGHWQEFNFYALFDFVQWHNPQLSVSLRVYLAQSKKKKNNNKTYLRPISSKWVEICRHYSTLLKGNSNYLLKISLSIFHFPQGKSAFLFVLSEESHGFWIKNWMYSLHYFGIQHHFKVLVCVRNIVASLRVKTWSEWRIFRRISTRIELG